MQINARDLARKIDVIRGLLTAEADVTAHIRDLLIGRPFGVRLKADQIAVDSAILPDSRLRPDLAIFETQETGALKQPDHLFAILEMKKDNRLDNSIDSVWREKSAYIQPATRYFYLIDQRRLRRYDLEDDAVHDWTWEELREPAPFTAAFEVVSASALRFEATLARFREGRTRFAYLSVERLGRPAFTRTVGEVSARLSEAIRRLVDGSLTQNVVKAHVLVADMESRWGPAVYDWAHAEAPIEFHKIVDPIQAAQLSASEIAQYEEEYDAFMLGMRPLLAAWRIETELLTTYAQRLGIDSPSLRKPRGTSSKPTDTGRAVESLAYETGALILARMLMVRFAEDHGLFETRFISNGGIKIFSTYAAHFRRPMQALLVETNRASAELFEHLFSPTLLDWALSDDDPNLSEAILAAAYLLSRWNFTTVRGDLLSGVYDRYLEPARRRAMGEVYTRPEVARYMLQAAGFAPGKTLLDPACGTGTFLIEAFSQELSRLRQSGAADDVDTLRAVLGRLSGLDLNPFAVVLAQIQILWHVIELLAGRNAEEVREISRRLIPAIDIHGGWSSLHPLGLTFATHGTGAQGQLAVNTGATERRAAASIVPHGFYRVGRRSYDLVCLNPPYVRAERQSGFNYGTAYDEVTEWQVDLYVYFIYRALRQWVRPGGRLAVIVPIAVLEADYAAKLRRVFREARLLEIVDLEGVAKNTFRGVKRVTVILVFERKVEPVDEDEIVRSVVLGPDAYDERSDSIDFTRARSDLLPRSALYASTYVPDIPAEWSDNVRRRADDEGAPLISKLRQADTRILLALKSAPRLGGIIKTCWRRTNPTMILDDLPPGANRSDWRRELVAGLGVKLGGSRGLAPVGAPIWKGQNIFPGGVAGAPIAGGFWNPDVSVVPRRGLMGYSHLFDYSRLYAVRDIAQLPTACLVPEGAAFQNSAVMIQLAEDFPLDLWLLSRVVQWYSARVLRKTILEDLGCHWYKQNLVLIPIPERRDAAFLAALRRAGEAVVAADRDIADRHRHADQILTEGASAPLRELILQGDSVAVGLDLGSLEAGPVPIAGAREADQDIVGDDLMLRIRVPDAALRRILVYQLSRLADDDEAALTKADFLGLRVPSSAAGRDELCDAIVKLQLGDGVQRFEAALRDLDAVVGPSLGLSPAMVRYCRVAMRFDPILSKMRPSLLQRGLRVQAYRPQDADEPAAA